MRCTIIAMMFAALGVIEVSSITVNISKITKLVHTLDGGCMVYQCSSPAQIKSEKSCYEIMKDIEFILDGRKS